MLPPTDQPAVWTYVSLAFVIAAVVAPVLIGFLHPLLVRYALARPNARSSHRTPTPQGGGIATNLALILSVVVTAALEPQILGSLRWLALPFASVAFLAVVGGYDDLKPLSPLLRLLLQLLALLATFAIIPAESRILPFIPLPLERAALILAMLWFVNLTNFMDGIDWMTVAEAVPVSAALAIFGGLGLLPTSGALIAAALCGAMIGFAPFNKPVARLFLGDVGSLPIGLILGWLLLILAEKSICAALLLPLYYIADATYTLLRRLLRGEAIMEAHRRHFYQQAVDSGQTVYSVVGRVFATNIALALLSLSALHSSLALGMTCLAAGTVLVATLLLSFRPSGSV
jgi:UDP-N-acetylmuramyl pentapeptide phosphotransferase/UDP-N-acetylglucosamine-1-phosphate transferase